MAARRRLFVGIAGACGLAMLASCAAPPVARDEAIEALREAQRAMGGVTLKTLSYTAHGTGGTFGQAYQPGMAWPLVDIPSFSRTIDYESGAMREDSVRKRAEVTGGGALPLMGMGELRTSGFLEGTTAWDVAGDTPAAAPVSLDQRIHDLWTTPHGIVKAALRNQPTMRREGTHRVVSFTEPGRFAATLWITPEGWVDRVDSVLPNPVLGDTQVVTLYSGWREFAGVRFPSHIQQHQGGFAVYDLVVTEVQANLPVDIAIPAGLENFTERVVVEEAASGVWLLAGGSHNSVLIEMSDHLILVESPLYEGRAQAVIAETKKLVPDKPLRYVINSHHHFDHAGGLRAAAAAGATLVVSEQARPWFERTLARPNTLRADALAKVGGKFKVSAVNTQGFFSDRRRTVEVFMIEDSVHAQGFMMVWLPKERLLVEADAYTPGASNAAALAQPNGNNVNLARNIARMRLDVDRILPLHGRIATMAQLRTAAGTRP
jgi:glyoxylase-like metal-dependent hydrolase (beta-lactamase superfamily II)